MPYVRNGDRVIVDTGEWKAEATVKSSGPVPTEVDKDEYISVSIDPDGVISGDPDSLETVNAVNVVEVVN